MKKQVFLFVLAFMAFGFSAQAQMVKKTAKAKSDTERTTFTVYGNCGMCERTIEGALKEVAGVSFADWDVETHQLTVAYNPGTISLDSIKQKVADVGYDSDTHRAKDEVYNNLHHCCQYERPKQ
ncbi:MAG: heavy-metal-associated domain-containing protein [Saprospiraceae bacterium]